MSTETAVRHPLFARLYLRLSAAAEKAGAAEHRRELLGGLVGRVVEVGAGSGLNFSHYPPTVSEVVAVEPEPFLRARAHEAAARAAVPVRVIDGTADALPLEDAAFDAGVASLMLCSVASQVVALSELRRVIRPGGELRFYEHVLASNARWARVQHRVQPLWTRFGGGCHPDRDTGAAIVAAGFAIERCREFLFAPAWIGKPTAPHILGVARRS